MNTFLFLLFFVVVWPVHIQAKFSLGVDYLEETKFGILKGKKVGLLTNPAGVNSRGVSTVDVLRRTSQVDLVALFGPEHGIYGNEKVPFRLMIKSMKKQVCRFFHFTGSLGSRQQKCSPKLIVLSLIFKT